MGEQHDTDATLTFHIADEERRRRALDAAQAVRGLEGYALVVGEGPRKGSYWRLRPGRNEAGRNTDALVFLDDVTVSRHHAEFTVGETGVQVKDLGSTNGTYINRRRLDEGALEPGDEVIIGRFHLVLTRGA